MGKIAKQSILTTISSYLGVLIGYVNILWLLPCALTPSEFGAFRTIQDMALLLVPFAQLGLGHGITRFYPQVKKHKFTFFTYSLIWCIVGFTAVAVLFLVFKDEIIRTYSVNSPQVNNYLGVVLIITFFSVIHTILDAFMRSFLKVAIPTFIREVMVRLLVSAWIVTFLLGWIDFYQVMMGLGLLYLMAVLFMIAYMLKRDLFRLKFNFGVLSQSFKGEFIKYSLITFLGTAGSILIMKIDSLMVSAMISLDANAIYTIGFSIAVVIEMPRRAISQVVMPVIAESFAGGRLDQIHQLYKKVAVNQLIICLLLFIGLWANIDNLYHFVPNRDVYEAGKWVVLLIGLGKLSDVIFSVNGEIIVFSKYYLFNITSTLLMSLVVILLNLMLIPSYGIEGAAMASFVAMFFYNLLKYYYIKVKLHFTPFTWDLAKVILVGLVAYYIPTLLLPTLDNIFLDLIIRSALIMIIYLTGIYVFNPSPEGKNMVLNALNKIKP
ncbi:polysaccharide biosynthesis protein [Litoribacter ruber]|uniref:oligosaccharide flippase family protein n=1 Tax=Litoribacter ruber TaxID=702568 RepID=UPI001BDAFD0C|nr:oligosaccharide flippase family protein [Litoribacter ruber]MBT0812617.1 polysaccharide biosynthesis protein [Litoribacter ruber]